MRSPIPVVCDCPKVRHEHGNRSTYIAHKCGCEPCKRANRLYQTTRERNALYGRPTTSWVDAGPVREHVNALRAAGMGRRTIVKRSGVAASVVTSLLYGRARSDGKGRSGPLQRITKANSEALLAVPFPAVEDLAPSTVVDGTGSRRRLQALIAIGWTNRQLSARLGLQESNFGTLLHGRLNPNVTAARHVQVKALYEELWNTPAPAGVNRTRQLAKAAREGWVPPLAWDDETIDDPQARPYGEQLDDPGEGEVLVDELAVEAAIRGRRVQLTRDELHLVLAAMRPGTVDVDVPEHLRRLAAAVVHTNSEQPGSWGGARLSKWLGIDELTVDREINRLAAAASRARRKSTAA